MQSKEEIEKAKENFKFFNEGDYITKEMVNSKEMMIEHMDQLETDKQKLIEKLEEDIEITKKQYTENTLLNIRVDGKLDTLEEILKILKGEN